MVAHYSWRRSGVVALLLLCGLAWPAHARVGPVPQWIWSSAWPLAGESARLETTITVGEGLRRATLEALADEKATLLLDDREVAAIEGHRRWLSHDISTALAAGDHQLVISATNALGPAGVALRLTLEYDDGHRETIVTDPTWLATSSEANAAEKAPAVSQGLVGVQPWGDPEGEVGDYYQWAKAKTLDGADPAGGVQVPPGFTVEKLRDSQPGESSWVSLAFDPQGRLVIGREGRDKHRGLLRLTLPKEAGESIYSESLDDTLGEPRGLVFRGQDLFVNANNDLSLFRLTDTGEGRFAQKTLLRTSPGEVGHGRNALAFGADGHLYSIHGNDTRLPEDFDPAASRCVHAAVDRLRTCRWDRALFDYQAKLPAGHLIRTTESGRPWELFACGFRNPYGLAFNDDGEAFTFDADNEGDLGTPWYRPTRINHIVSGGDYGWRQGTGMRPSWVPDSLPTNLDIGKTSPTGVKYGGRSAFPERYKHALFAVDWSYGRIYALPLIPRGASYAVAAEVFVEGMPLNVTDLEFGPDGALYFVTGGRATQSALYRVSWNESSLHSPSAAAKPPQVSASERTAAAAARARRRQFEAFHSRVDPAAIGAAWPSLSSTDPWLRHAARIAIEHQPVERWSERALGETNTLASVTALMALARSAKPEAGPAILSRLNTLSLEGATTEEQLIALRAYQLCLIRLERPAPELAAVVRARVEDLYSSRSAPVNQLACELLLELDSPVVLERTLALLDAANTQEERLLWLFELRNAPKRWTLDQRRRYLGHLAKTRQDVGGRELPTALWSIAAEFRGSLSGEEAQALADLLNPPPAETVAEAQPSRPFLRKWELEDLESALAESSAAPDAARGRQVFHAAQCVRCHRAGGEGQPIGPDLQATARRFSRRDLLETILVPSKVVDDKFRDVVLQLHSGRVVTGREIGGDDETVLIAADPFSPLVVEAISRADIETQRPSEVSPMPAGLLDTFTAGEIADLLTFFENEGQRPSAAGAH
ncbi:MAG: PQQ-dependent sugar dehydrogenase [Pirellulales bacterium]